MSWTGFSISFILTAQNSIAKPIAIPVTKVGENDLVTVLTNEKYLLLLLLANGLYITVGLIRSIWDSKKRQLDEITKLASMIPTIMQKIDHIEDKFKHVPTRDQTEIMIWKHMKDKDQ